MRGDQLGRQLRVIRAIEGSPDGLTVTEIAQQEETAPQGAGFSLHTQRGQRNRWAFIDTFKFKIPPPPTLTTLMILYFL